AERVTY
ncbi:S-ribosylhomocysteine lyase, partial [Vibrio harveyi]